MAQRNNFEMRIKFQDVESEVSERVSKIFQKLNERCQNNQTENFDDEDECLDDTEETDIATKMMTVKVFESVSAIFLAYMDLPIQV